MTLNQAHQVAERPDNYSRAQLRQAIARLNNAGHFVSVDRLVTALDERVNPPLPVVRSNGP